MSVSRYFSAAVLGVAMLCTTSALAQNAAPQGFLYGIGIGVNQEIYRGYSNRTIPLPILGYRGEKLSVYGPFASYTLVDFGNISFSAKLAPRFAGFDQSDSSMFVGMAKRKNSLDGGFGVQLRQQAWLLEADTVFDLLGNSNGQESKLALSYSYRAGPVVIEPKVGVSYSDNKLINYYYGVPVEEATADRLAYNAGGAFNYNAGVSFSTPLFFGGMTRLGIEHHWYDSSISNSPLTDRDTGLSAFLSWSTFF
ncbi:MipA/OmpV family protein [Rheinheimera baltica]|uniref:MipA/OmpV family protein n=1 Tax=Rheinheimera baltica TaxID=67576 RepID=UPI00273DE07F|nr:MipA/OmpV family protein [Rheinheimera baltica]MDP5151138.1 MipA/OmpV family protein [Rheinheimera baltica]